MSSVEDYMSTSLVMRDSKSSVLEVAKVMVDLNVSSVAITDEKEEEQQENNKQVIGILTERDIVKSITKGVSPDSVTAGSLMSSYPILSIRKDQPIEEAALLMIKNKVRHLLVEDDADTTIAHSRGGRIIGMITTTDLARFLKKKMKETIIPTSKEGNEKQLQRQEEEQQQQPQPQQEYSSETLLSEAWELYF